ncbi:MAG: glucose-6-phosphate isomerase [Alphaproteobacteria bacterium]|nr:glucose-6-phosphate isomerase [Alphaproteobacteria bacterium]
MNQTKQWKELNKHSVQMADVHLRQLFEDDSDRFNKYSFSLDGLLFDYSKNRVDDKTIGLLSDLAQAAGVEAWREKMFSGERINTTESRAVLHTALRNRDNSPVMVGSQDIMPDVRRVLDQMRALSVSIRGGIWKGITGEAITDIINIGIGGSDLGPSMACQALKAHGKPGLNCHFVSNADATQLAGVLKTLNPETTLIIVTSKTFTTQETMLNASVAKAWLVALLGDEAVAKHMVAVSADKQKVKEFGIDSLNMFEMWDWVGGRYSVWSAVGLPLAILIGMEKFEDFLAGAYAMDQHFRSAPLENNMPVLLALLDVWNSNFLGGRTLAVLPYSQALEQFPAYLQQLVMESNGKSVGRDGKTVEVDTSSVIFGKPGTNGQHAFMQAFHQGCRIIPTDFIVVGDSPVDFPNHHHVMIANAIAQSEALMRGKTEAEARADLEADGLSSAIIEKLLPHKVFPGNRPSNTLFMDKLDPHTLGMLIALYEHKTFVQGIIWGINSFDQWGVELGKQLAGNVLPQIAAGSEATSHDSSTNGLINHFNSLSRKEP